MEEPQARLRAMAEVLQIMTSIALAIVLAAIAGLAFRDLLGRVGRAR